MEVNLLVADAFFQFKGIVLVWVNSSSALLLSQLRYWRRRLDSLCPYLLLACWPRAWGSRRAIGEGRKGLLWLVLSVTVWCWYNLLSRYLKFLWVWQVFKTESILPGALWIWGPPLVPSAWHSPLAWWRFLVSSPPCLLPSQAGDTSASPCFFWGRYF